MSPVSQPPPAINDDRAAIERCLGGQTDAYAVLVARHAGDLRSYLSPRRACAAEIDDVAQEAFVRAYFSLGRLRDPARFGAWVRGIADRVWRERQRERRGERPLSTTLESAVTGAQPPSHDPLLAAAIEALPAEYREIIVLRYFGGHSCRQIADLLGAPLGTVTKRLSRAYELLRAALSEVRPAPRAMEVRP